MTLPQQQRRADTQSKLEYAELRRNQLMDELFSAKENSHDPQNLIHAAADILSSTRETFDYLGMDIFEGYLIPNSHTFRSKKLKKNIEDRKIKPYFPFHQSQVKNSDNLYHELKWINPSLYDVLVNFVDGISNGLQIKSTLFNYGKFMDLKDMVNEKKHNHLLAKYSVTDQELLIKGNGMSIILPIEKQKGWHLFAVQPGMKMQRVAEYRFSYNKDEVAEFCLFSVKATEIIIKDIYANYFSD